MDTKICRAKQRARLDWSIPPHTYTHIHKKICHQTIVSAVCECSLCSWDIITRHLEKSVFGRLSMWKKINKLYNTCQLVNRCVKSDSSLICLYGFILRAKYKWKGWNSYLHKCSLFIFSTCAIYFKAHMWVKCWHCTVLTLPGNPRVSGMDQVWGTGLVAGAMPGHYWSGHEQGT